MKLGIFDSGLGGLVIAKAVREHLPDIDIVYFGDTLHLPYGNRSAEAIYEYSKRAVEFLFAQDCALIITACNTVSASALRRLQQEYLPDSEYSTRRILGVVVPTLECAADMGFKRLGLIATSYTINSGIYEDELQKLSPDITLVSQNTPLLVPLIENGGAQWLESVLEHYLSAFSDDNIECLILGCTHYPFLKKQIREILGPDIYTMSQDEIIPAKLENYLHRHPEIAGKLERNGENVFLVSDVTQSYQNAANEIYNAKIKIEHTQFIPHEDQYKRIGQNS